MASVEVDKMRPNIRVEIHNNLAESMDVDEEEEGEICDDIETETKIPAPIITENLSSEIWPNSKAIFTTGINIFDKEEQEKLQERAKRFALRPEEINNFTDADLQQLHHTLGITNENEGNVRFDAVHMLGTGDMRSEDVLDYFSKYAPTSIEWVTEDSCNVIWLDKISAARAIYYTSRVVRGMPVRGAFPKNFDLMEDETEGSGQSILLKNANREVALREDEDILDIQKKIDYKNAVEIEEITIPIPPGYWRLGNKHAKAKCLLLRFALITDKIAYKEEPFSKYTKKIGVTRGIPNSRKKEFRSIFERNKELNQEKEKNPWGVLARNWDEDAKFREREPIIPVEEEPKVEIKNPSILVRLGKKTKTTEESSSDVETEVEESTKVQEKIKSKLPRMRMYADEEEEKMKRKKVLQTLKKQTEKLEEDNYDRNDLRNVLGLTNRRNMPTEHILETLDDQLDLGLRLKNRSKNMVFAVDREGDELENYLKREDTRLDARSFLARRRAKSPKRHLSPPIRSSPEFDRRSPIRRRSSRDRHNHRNRSPRRRNSPVRYNDQESIDHYYRSRREHHRRPYGNYSDDEGLLDKPRSKVAVVIKTQKKPTVASTIWSRVQRPEESESSDSSESEESSESGDSSSGSSSEEEKIVVKPRSMRPMDRPGFNQNIKSRLTKKIDHRSPLKIEIANDMC